MGIFDQIKVPEAAGPRPMGFTRGSNADLERAAPFRGLGSLGDILAMLDKARGGLTGPQMSQIGRLERPSEARGGMMRAPQVSPYPMGMQQGGLVQQVIADRQRVLDSFTPNPYDQYQYLMENPATRQAPPDVTTMPVDSMPAKSTGTFNNLLDTVQSATATSPLEDRIAELMGNRGMTQEEAAANQAFAAQQGADLNNDGAVTNAEYAQYLASQEPTMSIMPVEAPPVPTGLPKIIPQIPSPATSNGFLSSILSNDGIQKAIDDYRASMAEQSGDMDMAPATPAVPEGLQDRIRALTGGSGMMGGMIPNIDLDRLRAVMADLYGGQTSQQRFVPAERPRPIQIMTGSRGDRGLQ